MAEEKNPEGKPPETPPDPQASPPLQDPKTRGQEAALEAAEGDPSVQADAPKAAVPKAVPPPKTPIEGGAPTKPQAGATGVPPKPAAPAAHAAPKAPAVMAVKPWESELTKALKAQFGDRISEFSAYLGQNFLVAKPEAAAMIVEYLKLDADFDYLVDITAADYPKNPERFEVFYVLYSFSRNQRIRVKTRIPLGYKMPSVTGVHLTANWLEREVFDMFGIEFAGHPDLKRILLPDEWEGHPLRKEVPITGMDNRWVQENLGIESGQ